MSDRIPVYKLKLVQDRSVKMPLMSGNEPLAALALFFHRLIGRADVEHLATLMLNVRGEPLGASIVGIGSRNHMAIPPQDVLKPALLASASAIIVAHNHPSNSLQPSDADVRSCRHLQHVGSLIGVTLLDHFIVTPDAGFVSFVECGLLEPAGKRVELRANSYNSGAS